jgi:hypothetical protein
MYHTSDPCWRPLHVLPQLSSSNQTFTVPLFEIWSLENKTISLFLGKFQRFEIADFLFTDSGETNRKNCCVLERII